MLSLSQTSFSHCEELSVLPAFTRSVHHTARQPFLGLTRSHLMQHMLRCIGLHPQLQQDEPLVSSCCRTYVFHLQNKVAMIVTHQSNEAHR